MDISVNFKEVDGGWSWLLIIPTKTGNTVTLQACIPCETREAAERLSQEVLELLGLWESEATYGDRLVSRPIEGSSV